MNARPRIVVKGLAIRAFIPLAAVGAISAAQMATSNSSIALVFQERVTTTTSVTAAQTREQHGERLHPDSKTACAHAVASGAFALGAVGLGYIASKGGGVIVGIAITAEMATDMAAVSGSFSALEQIAGEYLC